MWKQILVCFLGIIPHVTTASKETVCLKQCYCRNVENATGLDCGEVVEHSANSSNEENSECMENLSFSTFNLNVSRISIHCFDTSINESGFLNFRNLSHLSIIDTNLLALPIGLLKTIKSLTFLNISGNHIQSIYFPFYNHRNQLEVLDLSRNMISEVYFEEKSLPALKTLSIGNNFLSDLAGIHNLYSLETLDISFNPLSLTKSNLHFLPNVKKLLLRSVKNLADVSYTSCTSCKLLPQSIEILDLSSNHLTQVPSCDGLLQGLSMLQILILDNNNIFKIEEMTFQAQCFTKLTYLSLHNNSLVSISPSFMILASQLQTLVLHSNSLQRISPYILQHFNPKAGEENVWNNERKIKLANNPWSCDCFQQELYNWLVKENSSISIICKVPSSVAGRSLKTLNESQLICSNASISNSFNDTAFEFGEGKLTCEGQGVPKPVIHWITPTGEHVSVESIANNSDQKKSYHMSSFGEVLTIKDVKLHKTGFYRCIANNMISSASGTVALHVLLSSTSTTICLVVVCVGFVMAIILNSVNMCMYIYEHIQAKRKYKKAVKEQEEADKENPPIRTRSRTLDDSMASLNADRHYGRYDYTCQQMFLDTVIKGAHTVKKTLYDARHSEFSTNMWLYAANLRDRLHIDFPSHVQLPSISMPSISMPSISMPTISMPSIPTMQDINTNIEKLSSSVMTKSHNLATSVGSVFTMKRWVWQQQTQNSSDSERSSEENLESAGVTSVQVDVHESPATGAQNESSRGRMSQLGRLFSSRDEAQESRSFKSLPDYWRPRKADTKTSIDVGEKSAKFVKFSGPDSGDSNQSTRSKGTALIRHSIILESPELNTVSAAVDLSCHSFETSV